MKRTRVTIAQVTAEENLLCALAVVNGSHRRERNHRLNKTVLRIESDPAAAIKALREILTHPDTYYPTKPRVRARWDANALKWRDIAEQPLEPRNIRTSPICYSCAAGCGSSCGGSLLEKQLKEKAAF